MAPLLAATAALRITLQNNGGERIMWTWFYKLASPPYVYGVAAAFMPCHCCHAAALAIAYGLIAGLGIAPPDYQQGEAFRMIYVHVPGAILSLTVYSVMAAASAVALIWRIKCGACRSGAASGRRSAPHSRSWHWSQDRCGDGLCGERIGPGIRG